MMYVASWQSKNMFYEEKLERRKYLKKKDVRNAKEKTVAGLN